MIDSLHKLNKDFKSFADFLTIYIQEAHAINEWPLGYEFQINQHVTLQDRIHAAEIFKQKYNWSIPLVVDGMENQFNSAFAAWPTRFYIVYKKKMVYISHPGNNGEHGEFWPLEVRNWLNSHIAAFLDY